MEAVPRKDANGANAIWRLVGKIAVIVSLTTAYVFVMQSSAFASGSLSSTILSIPEPGLVALPLGAYNGPITQTNIDAVMGSSSDSTGALGKALADGDVTGYIRTWAHQPSDGQAVVIGAFEFTFASEESSFLGSLNTQMHSQSGSEALAVPGISGASGAEVHTSTASGTPLSEYEVTFQKGNLVFQVAVVSSSGGLTSADALSIADRQYASAPDTPASTATVIYRLDWTKVGVLVGGILLTIALFIVGRKRKYPAALSGFAPPGGQSGVAPVAMPPAYWPPPEPTSAEQRPKVGADQWHS
jgi:hypothetical protein